MPLRGIGLPESSSIAPAPVSIREVVAPVGTSRTTSFLRELARAFARGGNGAELGRPARPESHPTSIGPGPSGPLRDLIAAAARQEGIPVALLTALVEVESGFRPDAVSRAGAKGLTQLMDGTARGLGVADPFDPWQNLVGGARYLRHMLDRYGGNVQHALAAYNAGPGAVDAAGGIPPYAETQAHVRRVTAAYASYANVLSESSSDAVSGGAL